MNARQKAKHYKRLYEALGATKINPTIIETHDLKHYKAEVLMPYRDLEAFGLASSLEEFVTGKLLSELEPVIKDSIVSETDPYRDSVRFSIDIWLKQEGETEVTRNKYTSFIRRR